MTKHMSCLGGVKVRFPGMSEVSGWITVSALCCFLLIFVVFTLCLPCYSSLLSACTVKRGGARPYSFLTLAPRALHLSTPVCIYKRIMHEKT